MKKVILHIGRHKTGTSSLQKFFDENRQALKSVDIKYLEAGMAGYGHHALVAALTNATVKDKTDLLSIDEVLAMRSEIDSAEEGVVLISSEAFQNMNPIDIRKIFDGYQVSVVVYLREQCGYLVSAYSQRIQASNEILSLNGYYDKTFSKLADYKNFLNVWKDVFGDDIRISIFDKEQMINGDIVADFCSKHLGFSASQINNDFCINHADINPSISNKVLQFKRRLNDFLPAEYPEKKDIYHHLGKISLGDDAKGLALNESQYELMNEVYEESNHYVNDKYLTNNQELRLKQVKGNSDPDEALKASLTLLDYQQILTTLLQCFPTVGKYSEENFINSLDDQYSSLLDEISSVRKEADSWQSECKLREEAWRKEHNRLQLESRGWQEECARREAIWREEVNRLELELSGAKKE